MGPTRKRQLELICECGGDLEKVSERNRAEPPVPVPPDTRTDEEKIEEVRKYVSKLTSRA